jgi:hypothetical protein
MRPHSHIALVVSLVISAAHGQPSSGNWETYLSPDGAYSASFPLIPRVMSERTVPGGVREILFGGEQFNPKQMLFQVQVIEPADPARIPGGQTSCPESVIALMDANAGVSDGQLPEYKRVITLGDVPGRETLTHVGRLWVRQRYYCDGKRIYAVQTFSTFRSDTDPDADRFLDSFRLR